MASTPPGSCGAAERRFEKSVEIAQLIKTRASILMNVDPVFSSSRKDASKEAPSHGIRTAAFRTASGTSLIVR